MSGPVAGALVAIPLLIVGLYLSEMRPQVGEAKGFQFGTSIILELLCLLRFGEFSFNATIHLHATAIAAWFGLFVTAMNSAPHRATRWRSCDLRAFRAASGHIISVIVFACLIPLGIVLWPGWFMFGVLTLFLGLRHPPPLDPYTPLDRNGRLLGWAAIVLFLLTFIPVPLNFVE